MSIEFTNNGAGAEQDGAGSDRDGASIDGPKAADKSITVVAHASPDSIRAMSKPDSASELVAELSNPTPTGGPLVFRVADTDTRANPEWVQVFLPVRPNGTTGWIHRDHITFSSNPYRIEVDVKNHDLTIFKNDKHWLSTPVAIGTGETPTPIGDFYIIELVEPPDPNGIYGPYAFGLSGFSETLADYAGGTGVIGIHGTDDPGALGSDVSHGCIRLPNDVITQLADSLPLGTPVRIT